MMPLLEPGLGSGDTARIPRQAASCERRMEAEKRENADGRASERERETERERERGGGRGKEGVGRDGPPLYGQLNEITRNRKLSDVPILLERPSATQKWCPWAELVAHNVDVHDDVRDDTPPRRKGIRRVVPTKPGAR